MHLKSVRVSVFIFTLAAAFPALAASKDKEVTIDGGQSPLHGSFRLPDDFKSGPAVLMIAGSGPTDRDGNSSVSGVRPASLKLLAEGLALDGVPSLRFDKRFIAASHAAAASEANLTFDKLVADAVAWTRFLAVQPGVRCVVVLGHSEGALIAAAVAARMPPKSPVCGIVEIAGAGRPADVVIEEQLAHAGAPPAAQATVKSILESLKRGQTVADVPAGFEALFRPSVQPYLISWLAYDPAATLKAAKAPVLIIQGDNDVQVSLADAHALSAARPDAKLLIVPGMNHILKDAPTDRAGNVATYADPDRPLAPELVPAIAAFVKAVGTSH